MRYEVIQGSTTGHCCFKYTVIDNKSEDPEYEPVCECYFEKDAVLICKLLNENDVCGEVQ